ncbi:MAG: hypothetical protein V1846_03840 [Candidatus Komeilibacteria bacterium]
MLRLQLSRKTTLTLISVVFLLVLSLGISWLMLRRQATNPLGYLPDSVQLAIAFDPRLSKSMPFLPPAWQSTVESWYQAIPQSEDIQYFVWGWGSKQASEEFLLAIYQHDVALAVRQPTTLNIKTVKLPQTGQEKSPRWLNKRVALYSTVDKFYPSSWWQQQFVTAPVTIVWKGDAIVSLAEQLQLDRTITTVLASASESHKLELSSWQSGWRVSWADNNNVVSTSTPLALFFPRNFDIYALVTPASTSSVVWWQPLVDQSIESITSLTSQEVERQLQAPYLFILNGQQWLLRSAANNLQSVGEQITSWQQPQIITRQLPDGSPYREIVRQTERPQSQTIDGQAIQYWGQVAENRVYFWQRPEASILTNSLELLGVNADQKGEGLPDALRECLGDDQGTITNLIWLRNSDIIRFASSSEQQLLFLELRTVGKSEKIACFGEK